MYDVRLPSAASAFSDSMEEVLLKRDAKKRQDMLDAHKIKMDEANLEYRKSDLQMRREDRHQAELDRQAGVVQKAKDAEANQYIKQVAGKEPGDVFTPDMAQRAINTGNADDFAPAEPQQFASGGDITTGTTPGGGVLQDAPAGDPQQFQGPSTTYQGTAPMQGVLQNEATPQQRVTNIGTNTPVKYLGSPKQRDDAVKEAKVKEITDRLKTLSPNSDDYRKTLVEYDMMTGKNISAGFIPKPDVPGAISDASYMLPGVGPIVGQRNKQGRIMYKGQDVTDVVKPYTPPMQPGQPIIFQSGDGPMLVNRGANTAVPLKGPDGKPLTAQVTGATRTMQEGAQMLEPHIAEVGGLADQLDKAGLFGPMASRMRHIAERVGTLDELNAAISSDPELQNDPLVGKFSSELALLVSGSARVHYGGRAGSSPGAIKGFKDMLSDASTAAMFKGRLSGLDSYMAGYAAGPGGHGGAAPASGKAKTKVFTSGPYKGKTGTLNASGSYDVEE
jgi:hypothetical protein